MENGVEIVQCDNLLDFIRQAIPGYEVEQKRSDYIPPVLVDLGAFKWLGRAVEHLAAVASANNSHLLTAYYADRREATDCCLVIGLQVRLSSEERPLTVSHEWATAVAQLQQQLLLHSVDMRYSCDDEGLHCQFAFPVFGRKAPNSRRRSLVLLVEDDPFVRNSTREVLEAENYRVLAAEDARDGLRLFQSHAAEIGLVISDVTMPGRDGRTLAALIRAQDRFVPILLISGYCSNLTEDLANQIYFLNKPFSAATLLAAMVRCLRGYHQTNLPNAGRSMEAAIASF